MRRFSRAFQQNFGQVTTRRRARSGALPKAVRIALAVLLTIALSEFAIGATPEPPRRPFRNDKPPAPQSAPKPAPEPKQKPEQNPPQNPAVENPAPQPAAQAARQPVDIKPEELTPYNLPPASRQRMRFCGERWRDLKMQGRSAGLTWRSFAEKCLPGQD